DAPRPAVPGHSDRRAGAPGAGAAPPCPRPARRARRRRLARSPVRRPPAERGGAARAVADHVARHGRPLAAHRRQARACPGRPAARVASPVVPATIAAEAAVADEESELPPALAPPAATAAASALPEPAAVEPPDATKARIDSASLERELLRVVSDRTGYPPE